MPRVARARARRRRTIAVAALLALLSAGAFLWTRDARTPPALAGSDRSVGAAPDPAGDTPDTASGSPGAADLLAPVPAWLAWIPGGFPEGFRDRIARDPGFDAAVVIAGDTRWMVSSRDAEGTIVDQPEPPFRIPIDAFAVDPDGYAPFLPDAVRGDVISALARGDAVLGESSAALRRIGPGGVMTFDGGEVTVGAVAPDELVGWSEMLVSRQVGERLGITTDRYMLVPASADHGQIQRAIGALAPDEAYVRIVEPGGTRYVRVASGVNPPVVMKQVFGEFSAYPRSDDPAFLNVSPGWHAENIRTRRVPILGKVTCNVAFFPALEGALQELVDRGLDHLIHIYSGCYAARTVARSDTAPPSQHAYGAAIDIDAPTNGFGDETPAMDPRVVRVFENWGFIWGGNFLIPDGMHFEYGEQPAA